MGIIDYKEKSKKLRESVLNDADISEANKATLKRFLDAYDVSKARETIFLSNIRRVLKLHPDITKAMHEREAMNLIFKKLKEDYSPATLDTAKNVTARLCTWLNEGDKPIGFKDVTRDRSAQLRNLNPDDMITWEDGKTITQQTSSLQIKAAFLTQLDCGFRPSEFIGLNYGDAKIQGDLVLFFVKSGKTGSRQVWMQRAVPAFLRWYDNHPTKRKDDPLWIMENNKRSHRKEGKVEEIERYSYPTLQKRFDLMFSKAGISKPSDFYNLRHSSCYLDKLDNVPPDLAAERHGHSVDFFVNTYGRLDIQEKLSRVRQHYGKPEEKRSLLRNLACERCKGINEPEAEFCRDCGAPLTAATAAKVHAEAQAMGNKLSQMEGILAALVESNPKVKKALEVYKSKIKN